LSEWQEIQPSVKISLLDIPLIFLHLLLVFAPLKHEDRRKKIAFKAGTNFTGEKIARGIVES
jgi:hypothetical protein